MTTKQEALKEMLAKAEVMFKKNISARKQRAILYKRERRLATVRFCRRQAMVRKMFAPMVGFWLEVGEENDSGIY